MHQITAIEILRSSSRRQPDTLSDRERAFLSELDRKAAEKRRAKFSSLLRNAAAWMAR